MVTLTISLYLTFNTQDKMSLLTPLCEVFLQGVWIYL